MFLRLSAHCKSNAGLCKPVLRFDPGCYSLLYKEKEGGWRRLYSPYPFPAEYLLALKNCLKLTRKQFSDYTINPSAVR